MNEIRCLGSVTCGLKNMRIATPVLAICLTTTSSLDAKEVKPRIATAVLCGIVTDLSGMPVAKAEVAAMWADFGTSQQTDELGRWSFGSGAGPHWMMVDGVGFETLIFDYVDQAAPKSSGADKPAFILPGMDHACPKPIFVRLAPRSSKAGFVTLDPKQDNSKKKKIK